MLRAQGAAPGEAEDNAAAPGDQAPGSIRARIHAAARAGDERRRCQLQGCGGTRQWIERLLLLLLLLQACIVRAWYTTTPYSWWHRAAGRAAFHLLTPAAALLQNVRLTALRSQQRSREDFLAAYDAKIASLTQTNLKEAEADLQRRAHLTSARCGAC
jgi:hypothetical protein